MTSTLDKDRADPSRSGFYKGMEVRQNDEYGRLRRQHLLHKKVMSNNLIRVNLPKDKPIKVLDSGTGDGLWMLDALDEYPQATFVGTDIHPGHFEQIKNLPDAITFKVQNLLDDWPAEDQELYDLVHQRYCLAQFSPEKDVQIVKNLFSLVKPGGYVQFVEADMMSFEGGGQHMGMQKFMDFVAKAFPQANMNHRPGPGIKTWLESAGASEIKEEVHEFKIGAAADDEDMRLATTENMNNIVANFAMVGSKWPGYWYTQDDFKDLAESVAREMETTGNTWKFWLVTARKI